MRIHYVVTIDGSVEANIISLRCKTYGIITKKREKTLIFNVNSDIIFWQINSVDEKRG